MLHSGRHVYLSCRDLGCDPVFFGGGGGWVSMVYLPWLDAEDARGCKRYVGVRSHHALLSCVHVCPVSAWARSAIP